MLKVMGLYYNFLGSNYIFFEFYFLRYSRIIFHKVIRKYWISWKITKLKFVQSDFFIVKPDSKKFCGVINVSWTYWTFPIYFLTGVHRLGENEAVFPDTFSHSGRWPIKLTGGQRNDFITERHKSVNSKDIIVNKMPKSFFVSRKFYNPS